MSKSNETHSEASQAGETPPPFLVKTSTGTPSPFVFAAPHSGRHYPSSMRSATGLTDHALRMSEDAFVDELFSDARQHGACLMVATYARAYLDLNRSENELDADMFHPALDESRLEPSHRVKAGLGIIPRLVAEGLPIYRGPLPAREAPYRIETVYRPYHGQLRNLLEARQKHFGQAVLVDCHSMPSEAKQSRRRLRTVGPDIVLGDNWGNACARELTSLAEELLIRAGFKVRRNVPYSGGFSTQHYGNPNQGRHALQIEINRAIYMNEQTLAPHETFTEIREKLSWFSRKLIAEAPRALPQLNQIDLPRAAE